MANLSRNEIRRLQDVQRGRRFTSHAGVMKKTTKQLVAKGLLGLRGEKVAVSGRLLAAGTVWITEAGIAALEGR